MITETQLKELSPMEERILRMKHGVGSNTKHSLSEIALQYAQNDIIEEFTVTFQYQDYEANHMNDAKASPGGGDST